MLEGASSEEFTSKASGMRERANSLRGGTSSLVGDGVGGTTGSIGDTPITGAAVVSRGGYAPTIGLGSVGTSVVSEGVTYVADSAIFNNIATNADNIATNAEGVATNGGRISLLTLDASQITSRL